MPLPPPSRAFLTTQIRWVRGRGLPAQDAEDVVFEAYHDAAGRFDPARGDFESFLHAIIRNRCALWWRKRATRERVETQLRLVHPEPDTRIEEVSALKQSALIGALSQEEQEVFAAWAIQKHLGKGQVTSKEMGESLGMAEGDYLNAKRRLKDKLWRLLAQFGWASVTSGEETIDEIA